MYMLFVFVTITVLICQLGMHNFILRKTSSSFSTQFEIGFCLLVGTIRICRILVILATVTSFLQIFLSLAWKEIRNGKSKTAFGGTVIATSILTGNCINECRKTKIKHKCDKYIDTNTPPKKAPQN